MTATASTAAAPPPPFTEEHEQFREVARRWVENKLLPHADRWEEAHLFDREAYEWVGEQGYFGLKFEERHGGAGGDYVAAAVWAEELSRCGSAGVGAGLGAHSEIALPPIHKFGTEEQKQRWLVPGIKGQIIAALAITEPDAGSDVAGIRTFAKKVDGGYLVNGSKMFITNGVRADVYVTAVKTTQEGGHNGLSFLLIEPGEGMTREPIKKMGWHASDTGLISFDDVFVPEENLLGTENQGFYLIMANFQWERLLMALGAIGGMHHWIEKTKQYALERRAFGRPIGNFQVTRHKFADMATTLQAGRAMTYDALRRFVAGENAIQEVTMAKLFTQRQACNVLDECLQIHGGAGYMVEYGIERAVRDARLGPIGGGTDEIMKEILSKSMGL